MPATPAHLRPLRARQAGLGLVSGVLLLVCGGIVLAAAARAVPVVVEYRAIAEAARQAAAAESPTAARARFDRAAQVEGIQSVASADLEIQGQGGNLRVAFAYQREVPLAGPVFLTFKLRGAAP